MSGRAVAAWQQLLHARVCRSEGCAGGAHAALFRDRARALAASADPAADLHAIVCDGAIDSTFRERPCEVVDLATGERMPHVEFLRRRLAESLPRDVDKVSPAH